MAPRPSTSSGAGPSSPFSSPFSSSSSSSSSRSILGRAAAVKTPSSSTSAAVASAAPAPSGHANWQKRLSRDDMFLAGRMGMGTAAAARKQQLLKQQKEAYQQYRERDDQFQQQQRDRRGGKTTAGAGASAGTLPTPEPSPQEDDMVAMSSMFVAGPAEPAARMPTPESVASGEIQIGMALGSPTMALGSPAYSTRSFRSQQYSQPPQQQASWQPQPQHQQQQQGLGSSSAILAIRRLQQQQEQQRLRERGEEMRQEELRQKELLQNQAQQQQQQLVERQREDHGRHQELEQQQQQQPQQQQPQIGVQRSKTQRRKLFGLFGSRRQNPEPTQGAKSNGLYTVSVTTGEGMRSGSSASSSSVPGRSKTVSERTTPKYRPIVIRSNTQTMPSSPYTPSSTAMFQPPQRQQPRGGAAAAEDGWPRGTSAGGNSSTANTNALLLDVEIPDIRLERYSIMFSGVLNDGKKDNNSNSSNQAGGNGSMSLLERRQATLEKLKTANAAEAEAAAAAAAANNSNWLTPGLVRRATSPNMPSATSLSMKSPAFSLFPQTPTAATATASAEPSRRPAPRSRSATSPVPLRPSMPMPAATASASAAAPAVAASAMAPGALDAQQRWQMDHLQVARKGKKSVTIVSPRAMEERQRAAQVERLTQQRATGAGAGRDPDGGGAARAFYLGPDGLSRVFDSPGGYQDNHGDMGDGNDDDGYDDSDDGRGVDDIEDIENTVAASERTTTRGKGRPTAAGGGLEIHDSHPLLPVVAEPRWQILNEPVAAPTAAASPSITESSPPRKSKTNLGIKDRHPSQGLISAHLTLPSSPSPRAASVAAAAAVAMSMSGSSSSSSRSRGKRSPSSASSAASNQSALSSASAASSSNMSTATSATSMSSYANPTASTSTLTLPPAMAHAYSRPPVEVAAGAGADDSDAEPAVEVEIEERDAALKAAVEISIARQISVSRQQRQMLRPLQTAGSPAAAQRLAAAQGGRIAETKASTPTLVVVPRELLPDAQYRRAVLVNHADEFA